MGFKDKAVAFGKKFKLDSHHAIERSGLFFGVIALVGVMVLSTSAVSAAMNGKGEIEDTAVWTPEFTTSKTNLQGDVDGVFTNELGDKALVMMHFDPSAQISYNAKDYEAFLLGSDDKLKTESVDTGGIKGSFYVFGSTGYVGVLLEADQPFQQQVLNLTVRANAELSFKEQQAEGDSADEIAGDDTFAQHDQWRVFVNPGAHQTKSIGALDTESFDPAGAFYEIVSKTDEKKVRDELDNKLIEMRTNLNQIDAYSEDLTTTKVDGLFLRPPKVPDEIAGDEITGESKSESDNGEASLALETDSVVPGGFNLNWRAGNVYDGYLDVLVPQGESYVSYLSEKANEDIGSDGNTSTDINNMEWKLSDGTDLTRDYQSSDVSMRPLMNVMNNLSQAYQDYYSNKREYQSNLTLDLLGLDVDLRDVQSNSSTSSGEDFLIVYY